MSQVAEIGSGALEKVLASRETCRIGILGVCHNHPYTYAALFNGYDAKLMEQAHPPVFESLEAVAPGTRSIPGARVEWVWAQDKAAAEHLARMCFVENVADRPEDLLGRVDAVMITEDDADTHLPLAEPFLRERLPIYVDRPLARRWEDVQAVLAGTGPNYPMLACSSFRYAPEVRTLKAARQSMRGPILFRGIANVNWFAFSAHVVEALVQVLGSDPAMVESYREGAGSFVAVGYPDGCVGQIQVVDPAALKGVHFSLHGLEQHMIMDSIDIYARIRRMLEEFLNIVRLGEATCESLQDTLAVMRILVGAQRSREAGGRRVSMNELALE